MKNVRLIALSLFLISVLMYGIGRAFFQEIVKDDVADWFLWSGGISLMAMLFVNVTRIPVTKRRGLNFVAVLLIFLLTAFGYWGLFTAEGNKQYEEMAALLPFFALTSAGVILLVLLIVNLVWKKRKKASV